MAGDGHGKLLMGAPAFGRLMSGKLDPGQALEALADMLSTALGGSETPEVLAFTLWYLSQVDDRLLEVSEPGDRCDMEVGMGYWQRHTARVLAAADFLSSGWGFSREMHDAACVAATFHDASKYDDRTGEWAGERNPDHARIAMEELRAAVVLWEDLVGELQPSAVGVLSMAADAIGTHMSVWSPSTPVGIAQMAPVGALLATCDIFSSQAHQMWPAGRSEED